MIFYSEFDLYTKSDSIPDVKALTPYYQSLIDKYIPGNVLWWIGLLLNGKKQKNIANVDFAATTSFLWSTIR